MSQMATPIVQDAIYGDTFCGVRKGHFLSKWVLSKRILLDMQIKKKTVVTMFGVHNDRYNTVSIVLMC